MLRRDENKGTGPDAGACWIDVALSPARLPGGAAARARTVYVVVDVIRATTTLCVLFERGCQQVYVAGSVAGARQAGARLAVRPLPPLLAGEIGGVAPPGFDYGNSPAEIGALDMAGRVVVFATTNGTRALHACRGGAGVLAGALRNASAVARTAVTLASAIQPPAGEPTAGPGAAIAQAAKAGAPTADATPPAEAPDGDDYSGPGIAIVCSGRDQWPAFDDTLCAGYLVSRIEAEATARGLPTARRDGALIALATSETAQRRGLRAALAASGAAVAIAELGLEADITWCAEVDTCTYVPAVLPGERPDDLLLLEAWPGTQ
jgi:2-phosphosulfolactate phosphatase